MTKQKKIIAAAAILLILVAAAIFGSSYYKKYADYQKIIDEMTFMDIDLSAVADGIYTGEFDTGVIYARVEVIISAGQISQINLLQYEHERGEDAVTVLDRIQQENRLDVDAVSGATNSSKVLRKAVENALTE